MNRLDRRGVPHYDDLIRELETIQHDLMSDNPELAMNLMVVEAKIRERFQRLEDRSWERYSRLADDKMADLSPSDIRAMIPHDLAYPVIVGRMEENRTVETVGMALLLAVMTAAGVFGLASILQLVLGWAA